MLENLLLALIISLTLQGSFFITAFSLKTDKLTDLSYGLTFIILAVFFFIRSSFDINQITLTLLILFWGTRIAGYLFIRILKTKKDQRFDNIRENFFKFGIFWLFQAIAVWIIILPSIVVLSTQKNIPFQTLTLLGLFIWLLGFLIEAVSDQQKFIFKSDPKNKEMWISTGLWKYSRHPNYFGEILCWFGIFVFSIPYLSGVFWFSIFSPIFITSLLLFVTGVPPLEKRYDKKFKEDRFYRQYKRRTSLLVPLPRKR